MARKASTYRYNRRNFARTVKRQSVLLNRSPVGSFMEPAPAWCTQGGRPRSVGAAAAPAPVVAMPSDHDAEELVQLCQRLDRIEREGYGDDALELPQLKLRINELGARIAWGDQWASHYEDLTAA
jgi:hypothetical protein